MDELCRIASMIDCVVGVTATKSIVTGETVYSVRLMRFGKSAEIIENGLLTSTWGSGSSLDAAAVDYIRQIAGQRIVFDPYSDTTRFEFEGLQLRKPSND